MAASGWWFLVVDMYPAFLRLNGRRVVPFNLDGFSDSNMVPLSMIDRVELVTGGASAVYGADAVAGVVNFILKKNFTGFEFSGTLANVTVLPGGAGISLAIESTWP